MSALAAFLALLLAALFALRSGVHLLVWIMMNAGRLALVVAVIALVAMAAPRALCSRSSPCWRSQRSRHCSTVA
jgi:hypothetical protein